MDRDLGRRWCSGRRGGTALGTGRCRRAGRGGSHWDRVVIGGGLIDFVRDGPEVVLGVVRVVGGFVGGSAGGSSTIAASGSDSGSCSCSGSGSTSGSGAGAGAGSGAAGSGASVGDEALRGRSPPARERPSTGRSSVLRHSWRAARMVRVWAAARAPVYPSRRTAHDALLRIADRRHKEAGYAGARADEAEEEEDEGHARQRGEDATDRAGDRHRAEDEREAEPRRPVPSGPTACAPGTAPGSG